MSAQSLRDQAEIIVAFDNLGPAQVLPIADIMKQAGIEWVKIGLELFTKIGPEVVLKLKKSNFKIFLDLKLFDIPNTVSKAVKASVDLGVDLITLHALGSSQMMIEAQKSAENTKTKIVAVTLLTSISDTDLFPLHNVFQSTQNRENIVLGLATMAAECGMNGIVCSANELKNSHIVSLNWNSKPIFVTPGIRSKEDSVNDQKNVSTIESAISFGATHLVMGRPILFNHLFSPLDAAKNALKVRDNCYGK